MDASGLIGWIANSEIGPLPFSIRGHKAKVVGNWNKIHNPAFDASHGRVRFNGGNTGWHPSGEGFLGNFPRRVQSNLAIYSGVIGPIVSV